jgi:hypothetical protein
LQNAGRRWGSQESSAGVVGLVPDCASAKPTTKLRK